MLLMVMPSGPSSTASVRVSIRTPPLLAQYAAKFGNASSSCTELMLMILPGRPRGDALLHERLGGEEHALQVDVEHRVEVRSR